jgi:aminoglycoside phosphotransferase (APT) family kinase protein
MPAPTPAEPPTGQVIEALATQYGLMDAKLVRLPIGQGTVNYQAVAQDRILFVKRYPSDADLTAEAEAIALTQLADEHGVPVATVLPARTGEAITRHRGVTISVWEWVPGHTVEKGFSHSQQAAAGQALGRIHRAFADHPASAGPSPELDDWLNPDINSIQATVDKLLGIIHDRDDFDDFDNIAAETLTERRAALHRVPGLLAELPELTCQVLHGDYSAVNLLFDGEQLAAVLDFRPPEPFLVAFELGRIAFDPRTVVLNDDWITSAATLVTAYLQAHPDAAAADVRACDRIALIQLLTSLYGVKNHYLKPGLLQGDLDAFWLLRHRAAQRLLTHLNKVDTVLAKTAQAG